MPSNAYRGRFAPSPTGPLHFGSLVAALASFLDARQARGVWLVRIEDIDPLREIPGATSEILQALEAHGLHWDESVLYQSRRKDLYQNTLDLLLQKGYAYYCPCSRKALEARQGQHDPKCGQPPADPATAIALRMRVPDGCQQWVDRVQRHCEYPLQSGKDDFVLKRKEGFFAYQLAVVHDDIAQHITQVVRGSDLLDSTPLQLTLYQALGHTPPRYAHIPVIHNGHGQKLSKQNLAPALDCRIPGRNLWRALQALNLPLAPELAQAPVAELLAVAIERWSIGQLAPILSISEQEAPGAGDA